MLAIDSFMELAISTPIDVDIVEMDVVSVQPGDVGSYFVNVLHVADFLAICESHTGEVVSIFTRVQGIHLFYSFLNAWTE